MANLAGGKRLKGPSPSNNMDEQIWRDPVTAHGKGTPSRSSNYVKPRPSRLSKTTGTGLTRRQGGSL